MTRQQMHNEFKLLLDKFNTVELDPERTKGSFKYSVN